MSDRTEAWLTVLVILVVVATVVRGCAMQRECTERGGFLASGKVGYVCVEASGVEALR